ncbi:unnamed protein product, partial [Chrysoparadoxa australica]
MGFIRHACGLRATETTGVHDASSRSHAICKVFMHLPDGGEGTLVMVDLAGSETSIDSAKHNAARRKECAQINSSLMALKDCIRCLAKGASHKGYQPFRKSKLTLFLRPSFTMKAAETVVVATVSPGSKDTEHTLNTLRHACIMDGQGTGAVEG